MTVQEFITKYFELKREMGMQDIYIPFICDRLYPRADKMTRGEMKREIYRYYDMWHKFEMSPLAKQIRRDFENGKN